MKPPKIANTHARAYVTRRAPFKGSHMYAEERVLKNSTLYIVYSYGVHFPIYIAETAADVTRWYANADRYSRSTTRHQSQAHPHVDTVPMDATAMRTIAQGGLMAHVQNHTGYTAV